MSMRDDAPHPSTPCMQEQRSRNKALCTLLAAAPATQGLLSQCIPPLHDVRLQLPEPAHGRSESARRVGTLPLQHACCKGSVVLLSLYCSRTFLLAGGLPCMDSLATFPHASISRPQPLGNPARVFRTMQYSTLHTYYEQQQVHERPKPGYLQPPVATACTTARRTTSTARCMVSGRAQGRTAAASAAPPCCCCAA